MPNWTGNVLTFENAKDAMKVWKSMRIREMDGTEHFSFGAIIPSPKTKEECPKEFIVTDPSSVHIVLDDYRPWFNWYDWQQNYWGVKWDACEAGYDGNVEIYFDSPWCKPKDEIFQGIADKFHVSFSSYHTYEDDDEAQEFDWYPNKEREKHKLE